MPGQPSPGTTWTNHSVATALTPEAAKRKGEARITSRDVDLCQSSTPITPAMAVPSTAPMLSRTTASRSPADMVIMGVNSSSWLSIPVVTA